MTGGTGAVLVIAAFALLLSLAVRATLRARQERLAAQRALGLEPVPPTAELVDRVNRLYHATRLQRGTRPVSYRLSNVSGKPLPDGALFLLDAVEDSSRRNRQSEGGTVLVASPLLDLPPFIVFPRAATTGALAGLANTVIDWAVGKWGEPVTFPEVPEFEQRYVVSSSDPDRTRRCLEPELLRWLAETRQLIISAAGDTFALGRLELARKPGPQWLQERVDAALELHSRFLTRTRAHR